MGSFRFLDEVPVSNRLLGKTLYIPAFNGFVFPFFLIGLLIRWVRLDDAVGSFGTPVSPLPGSLVSDVNGLKPLFSCI